MQKLRNVRRSSLTNLLKSRFSSKSLANFSSSPSYSAPSDPFLSPNQTATRSRFLSFLKFTAFGSIAAAFSTAGYATYAYTADEVDEKTKAFRSSINHPMIGSSLTAEALPHMVYSAVMTVPSKAIDLYLDLRRVAEEHIQEIADPNGDKLLPDMDKEEDQHRVFTLVLDLSDTLILNEWKRETGWATFKRPGLDDFLAYMAQIYEIVVYCDVVVDENLSMKLMEKGVRFVLSRPATKYQDGKHFRDLSRLNREPSRVLYVSGHALENCLQTENCIPIRPWKKEAYDTTLIDLIPFLEYVGVQKPADIRQTLASYSGKDIPSEFINRSREFQRQLGKKKIKAFSWSRN